MAILAALLSAEAESGKGIFLRIDELADVGELTTRHLPQIRSCDLPAGRYLWIADERKKPDGSPLNDYGGAFWDLDWMRSMAATRTEALASAKRKGRLPPEFRNDQITFLAAYLEAHDLLKG